MENWKKVTIKPFGKAYEVSDHGNVRRTLAITNTFKNRFLKNFVGGIGYRYINLRFKKYRRVASVHRLVALAFIQNSKKHPQVNHIDCNKTNNHISNLEWCSRSHNMQHAHKNGLMNPPHFFGIENKNAKLTEKAVFDIRTNCIKFSKEYSTYSFARKYNVRQQCVSYVLDGKTWKHLLPL